MKAFWSALLLIGFSTAITGTVVPRRSSVPLHDTLPIRKLRIPCWDVFRANSGIARNVDEFRRYNLVLDQNQRERHAQIPSNREDSCSEKNIPLVDFNRYSVVVVTFEWSGKYLGDSASYYYDPAVRTYRLEHFVKSKPRIDARGFRTLEYIFTRSAYLVPRLNPEDSVIIDLKRIEVIDSQSIKLTPPVFPPQPPEIHSKVLVPYPFQNLSPPCLNHIHIGNSFFRSEAAFRNAAQYRPPDTLQTPPPIPDSCQSAFASTIDFNQYSLVCAYTFFPGPLLKDSVSYGYDSLTKVFALVRFVEFGGTDTRQTISRKVYRVPKVPLGDTVVVKVFRKNLARTQR